ncbi:hypothetical protein FHP06_06260 [Aeromicrobium terrae]|uniref:DUF3352 domain-containing protein n=1 Tax=Aeromicrobium terrae TaxID=2498846 RepID=A0A5C8NMB9_9ACTN|nr:hypothetical protein FHP06_06260 [Aeromicrobium terrae]
MAAVVVIAAALGLGWSSARVVDADARPDLTAALDTLPVDVRTVGFTDWASIRTGVGVDEATPRDLATRSVIAEQADVLDDVLGWSLSDVDWEVYAQTNQADHATVRLSRSVSFADVRTKLRSSGYTQDGRLWTVPEDELVGKGLTDLEAVVALVPRKRLVVLTSAPAPAHKVLKVIDGDTGSLAGVRAARDTAQALAGHDTVLLQSGRDGCKDSAVANDPDAEQQARTAVQRAGSLRPYVFSGRALRDEGGSGFGAQRVVFVMTFGSPATASDQASVREELASGPFIGRQGRISETLRDADVRVEDSTVRMAFDHDPDTDVFMTGVGPVLFASC